MFNLFKKKDDNLKKLSLNSVQQLFEMLDVCKELKVDSITKSQLETMQSAEMFFKNTIKELYVPDYQSKNI